MFPGGPVFIENEQALKEDIDAETVQIGDVLLTLGDAEVKGMSEAAIKEVFRGPADTRVQLGFVRHPAKTEPSAKHFGLGVLRRSSVRSKTEIFQGTPEKEAAGGDRGTRGAKSSREIGSENGIPSDLREEENMLSERLTADDFKVIAEENSVLKQSLVSMEQQLEEAERKTELTIKIIERVQQLEDKLLETEFNFSVLKQQGETDKNVAHENVQLKEMLQDARNLYSMAVHKCQHSEQELERAQHTIRLHAEREHSLRREIADTKSALDKSRSSEGLLRKQLQSAELAIRSRPISDRGGSSKPRAGGGMFWSQEIEHESEMGSSRRGLDRQLSDDEDELHGFMTPTHGKRTSSRHAFTENAKGTRRNARTDSSRQSSMSPPGKDGETSLISRYAARPRLPEDKSPGKISDALLFLSGNCSGFSENVTIGKPNMRASRSK